MILSLYIARRFVWYFFLVFAGFFTVIFLFDTVDQIRRYGSPDFGLPEAATIALLNTPGSIHRILPLVTILATIALCVALARSSELVVARATGRSALATLAAPVVAAFLIGVAAVTVLNPIVAATTKRSQAITAGLRAGNDGALSVTEEGLWLRQGGPDGQTVIRAGKSNLDATDLRDVSFFGFDTSGLPTLRVEAASASLKPGAWVVRDAKVWQLDGTANPEQTARHEAELSVPSTLTAEGIRDSFGDPAVIPIWDLPGFIDDLAAAGYSALRHQIWFQMELAVPLLLVAMVLVGAGFTMRHTRFGHTGVMVLLAILSGFAVYFLRNFAQVLGENAQIPVVVAAWAPPVAAILASLGLVLHLEDG
ncbi:MAG: LPS export ABC transporter permease LptG [Rhodobacteraceae bacterium]|nr:LPS export ABC transporter permease LptG [Paracoccaceae bacterium]